MTLPRALCTAKADRADRCFRGVAILLATSLATALPGAEDSVKLERVEVKARGVEAAWASTPAAVTAYSGDFMAANGITDYEELARIVPGLFVVEQSADFVSMNLRGLSTDTTDPRGQPRVSVFQDGVAINNAHGNSVALFDMSGVAVLKGPQPTQFGRGVEGGALVLSSNRASEAASGALTVGVGDYRLLNASGYVNQPLVPDTLFARVAMYASRSDGYVSNRADGSDLQGEATLAIRASLRWQPAPATTADLILSYQHDDMLGVAFKSGTGVPGLAPVADTDPFTPANLNRGSELGGARTIKGLTGILSHKLNAAWTLTSVSAWREVDSHHEFDIDGTFHYLLEPGEVFEGRQLSQDVRLDYDGGERLTARVGAGVFHAKDQQDTTIRADENALWSFFTQTRPPVAFNPRYSEESQVGAETTAADAFGRVDYKLTPRLTLGGGLRLTREEIVSRFRSVAASPRGNLIGLLPTSGGANNIYKDTNGRLSQEADVDSWSGQVDARFAITPHFLTYATVSRGRRPPVLDFHEITLVPIRHAEERVLSYEVGLKGSSASRRLRYDASIFRYDFEHFQTRRIVPPGVIQPYDGGRARGQGFEATVQAEVTRSLTMFATYGYTDAAFAERDDAGARQLFAGNTFRLTSRHVASVGGTVLQPVTGGGALFLTPLFTYRSGYYFEDNNAQNGGSLHQAGYGLVNLRAGYRAPNTRWEIVAYATNLLDKNYLLDAGNVGGAYGIPTFTPAAPRQVGMKATLRF
ncbi:MAG: TonB-dependent receptor [Verrucomicrobiota bacterium]